MTSAHPARLLSLLILVVVSRADGQQCPAAVNLIRHCSDFRCMHLLDAHSLDAYYGGCGYPCTEDFSVGVVGQAYPMDVDVSDLGATWGELSEELYEFDGEFDVPRQPHVPTPRLASRNSDAVQVIASRPCDGASRCAQSRYTESPYAEEMVIGTGVLVEERKIDYRAPSSQQQCTSPDRQHVLETGYDRDFDRAMSIRLDVSLLPRGIAPAAQPTFPEQAGSLIGRAFSTFEPARWLAPRPAEPQALRVARRLANGELFMVACQAARSTEVGTPAPPPSAPRALALQAAATLDRLSSAMSQAAAELRAWADNDDQLAWISFSAPVATP